MMTRADKAQYISALSEKFAKAKATFIVDYKGMNVEEVTKLRKSLTPLNAEMKVVRNTLAKLALNDHPAEKDAVADKLVGTNAFVFAYDDVGASAKALADFGKDVEALKMKSGVMEGNELDEAKIKFLSTLPPKDVLRAQLLGVFNAPGGKFVRTLAAVPQGMLNVLTAYKDQKGE